MPINKKLTKKIALNALAGAKIAFSFGTGVTKATLNSANDMAGYFTGVKLPNRIGDSLLDCGAQVGNGLYKLAQNAIKRW